jgi:hypothetical protein
LKLNNQQQQKNLRTFFVSKCFWSNFEHRLVCFLVILCMKNFLSLAYLLLFLCETPLLAQVNTNAEKYHITIKKAKGKIVLDGKIDESDWQTADVGTNFWQALPFDTSFAKFQTEARLTFDDTYLYVSGVCYQPRKYVVVSLKRDFQGGTTDVFGINLDTFKDKQNSFNFAVSPYGVQRDGLVSNGSELSTDWDNKWYSEVRNYDDRWVVEMAIPFKTLRYKPTEGINEWLVNFLRFDQSQTFPERSSWAGIPRNFNGNNIAFSGTMIWDSPPPKPGANISVIPYLLGGLDKDFVKNSPAGSEGAAGFDAKVSITPSLNLDLTVNPDFAQVEVDQQVQNISRFEVFFPERRQFFLENSDLFANFGFDNITPFFSRRIGLAYNPKTDQNERVPIIFGARLSGRLDKNWRIGFLNMQTASKQNFNLGGANFGMLAIQRRVFSRSNVAFMFVNKQNWLYDSVRHENLKLDPNGYTRIVGLEYNLASADGRWTGKAFYHKLLVPETKDGQFAAAAVAQYSSPTWHFTGGYETVGQHYDQANETGYVVRNDYWRIEPNVFYTIYPKSKLVNSINIGIDGDFVVRRTDDKILDWDFSPIFFGIRFQNSAQLRITPRRINYTYLFDDFDPTRKGAGKLLANTEYTYADTRLTFTSDARKAFFYNVQARLGEYFSGNITQVISTLSYRYQPYGVFSVQSSYNRIKQPYGTGELILVGPKVDVSFSRNVFLSTFMQYNNLSNNVNLNTRFQWRFKPASDLFIVYTENYTADAATIENRFFNAFESKNRALVVKLTYWLNI